MNVDRKDRLKLSRQHMPAQHPEVRKRNFEEVNFGLPVLMAKREAQRCLECAQPACVRGCPLGVKIREFVELVLQGDYLGAAAKIREDNALPAITSRVCPQEKQCEGTCVLGKRFEPLAIGYLERFVADYERRTGRVGLPQRAPRSGQRVAIIGSGPAGLSAAGDLVQKGHEAKVFEAQHEIGGMLTYGIPEFRLPKEIVREEVENLRRMGVEFKTDSVIGEDVTIDELLTEGHFDAVFVATGAEVPRRLEIPGEDLHGVYSAHEFLARVNLSGAYLGASSDQKDYDFLGERVVVVGGGNTAFDAVRCAVRLGATEPQIIYRRTEKEMPVCQEEFEQAEDEGVHVMSLVTPLEFLGDKTGSLHQIRCVRTRLAEPDDSGRPRPLPIEGSEFLVDADVAITAVGTRADPLVRSGTPDLETDVTGYLRVDPETHQTSKKGVFAGGDVVTGTATVVLAMAAGRRAAKAIHRYLRSGEWSGPRASDP